jgi:hypothetical protein
MVVAVRPQLKQTHLQATNVEACRLFQPHAVTDCLVLSCSAAASADCYKMYCAVSTSNKQVNERLGCLIGGYHFSSI